MTKAELLGHSLINKGSERSVSFAEFAAEAGLSERRARELLLRVAADNKVKLPADLTIPGLR